MKRYALGYFIEPQQGTSKRYFVRDPHHAHCKHHMQVVEQAVNAVEVSEGQLQVFNAGDLIVTPVYDHAKCPHFVIITDVLGTLGTFYTQWTPLAGRALETDHAGVERYEVVDFAFTRREAEAIVKQNG